MVGSVVALGGAGGRGGGDEGVATGVVEEGCKHIVGTRLKQGGMRWTVAGANAILALRCAVESNRFDDFRERRACAQS